MRAHLRITRSAKLDLDELIVYVGAHDPAAAIDVASKILERIELLREQPELGRIGRRPGTRELVVDGTRYVVCYRHHPGGRQVEILRVLHASRRWPKTL